VIEIAGGVNNTVDLNGLPTDNVEDQVGLNNEDTIAVLSKLGMARYPPKERMILKLSNAFIKPINEGKRSAWTILCDELKN